jgi:hypothetical protein
MTASAAVAAVLGLAPHVLHHVGPLAGAALFAGIGGSIVFGVAGLMLSIPFLLRVRHRCGNWRVPALVLATFAAIFSVSTFVVGPWISAGDDAAPVEQRQAQPGPQSPDGHEEHHR